MSAPRHEQPVMELSGHGVMWRGSGWSPIPGSPRYTVLQSAPSMPLPSPHTGRGRTRKRTIAWFGERGTTYPPICNIISTGESAERDFSEIPDLHFNIELLISAPPYVASRLRFDCTPQGTFLGLQVNGTRVFFSENVFYEFRGGKIREVWSVIDKAAIEAQL